MFVHPNFDPVAFSAGPLAVRWYGLLCLVGFAAGWWLGRRHPDELAVGDTLDFWRVEAYAPHHRLRLAPEMKLPGCAWLEFEVTPGGSGAVIRQTAVFDPSGLLGLLSGYGIYPLHRRIFAGMLRALGQRAAQESRGSPTSS